MKQSQLNLRLDTARPDPSSRWCDGAALTYLGSRIVAHVDSSCNTATLQDGILRLPLPPGATARQVQDSVEAWLRSEATRLFEAILADRSSRIACRPFRWALSFGTRGNWVVHHADGSLRISWRLIEQPAAVIEQVVADALAALRSDAEGTTGDFWEMQLS